MSTTTPTRRHLLAGLAAGAAVMVAGAAGATGYGHRPAPWYGKPRFLQVYSFGDEWEAVAKARHLRRRGFEGAEVFLAYNGYFAVTAGRVARGDEQVVDRLKWKGAIPHDSFLTSGKAYRAAISLDRPSYQPHPYHAPRHQPRGWHY